MLTKVHNHLIIYKNTALQQKNEITFILELFTLII